MLACVIFFVTLCFFILFNLFFCWVFCRRARFKRSNSVTASVQADLDPEGFPGLSIAVPTQDKSLQFGCSFQRHSSEPESASQYTECQRTVHTQGQWAYREVGPQNCVLALIITCILRFAHLFMFC